jgi:outer membrane protein assembly factor BamB
VRFSLNWNAKLDVTYWHGHNGVTGERGGALSTETFPITIRATPPRNHAMTHPVHLFGSVPAIIALLLTPSSRAADWPQLQNGPQRLGYSAEKIDCPLERAWAVGFSPERLHPQAQPIVAAGKVFIGTAMGTFYAFDARTGAKIWTRKVGGPILHTAGFEGDKVFLGCLDGRVYALNAADGTIAWTFDSGGRTGFSTAVLLADQKVFIANRSGIYYALGQADGKGIWRRDIGAPILMSSAMDNGRLFFGAMDMRAYALDASTGEILWKSDVLKGSAFKDYWPVAYKGLVLIRPARISGGAYGKAIEWHKGPLPAAELPKQDLLAAEAEKNPDLRNLYVLDQKTGQQPFVLPQWVVNTMNGATAPPCVDGDGLLIIPVALHDWRGGWGRLDIEKRRVVEVLHDGDPNRRPVRGTGNTDENLTVSAAGRLVFTIHTEEGNAHFTGLWHLDRRDWWQMPAIHVDPLFSSNTQGGGGNPMSISNSMAFHTSNNTLNGRKARPAGN